LEAASVTTTEHAVAAMAIGREYIGKAGNASVAQTQLRCVRATSSGELHSYGRNYPVKSAIQPPLPIHHPQYATAFWKAAEQASITGNGC
jgi:hypothetical protein